MIALTSWNDRPIYVDPHEIAIIEPASADPVFIASPEEFPVDGSVITFAAGRTVIVKEETEAIYDLIKPVIEPVRLRRTGEA